MKNILFLCLMLSASFANAQDLFQKNLYSADRVMEMRNALELTDSQALNIKKIHSENAGKFSAMKWDLDDATEKLKALLDESKVDAVAVQKQMDKVLALENSLKKQQLSTMVSIKNELTPEQQGILQSPRIETVNGVSVIGYGKNSVSTATTGQGYSTNYKIGKPLLGAAGAGSASSPQVSVIVAGTDQNKSPLFFIETKEGMKEIKDLKNISPNDIESMEVLKGKSAMEKYGEKGENGIVIIKLKSGTKK